MIPRPVVDEVLAKRIYDLIQQYPAFGWRKIWALLRFREGVVVDKKKVHRIMKLKGWLMNQWVKTPRPRVKVSRSVASKSNERWAVDMTHINCGVDGWGHLVAVIDCYDRQSIGYEFALRGRSHEAQRALEEACLKRFGTLYPSQPGPVLRSDNGLNTPLQNGMIERFFRSLKEECAWLFNFESFKQARRKISEWLQWYNEERPHQALKYRSPNQFREQQLLLVAWFQGVITINSTQNKGKDVHTNKKTFTWDEPAKKILIIQ